jgi:hypothetical protein
MLNFPGCRECTLRRRSLIRLKSVQHTHTEKLTMKHVLTLTMVFGLVALFAPTEAAADCCGGCAVSSCDSGCGCSAPAPTCGCESSCGSSCGCAAPACGCAAPAPSCGCESSCCQPAPSCCESSCHHHHHDTCCKPAKVRCYKVKYKKVRCPRSRCCG